MFVNHFVLFCGLDGKLGGKIYGIGKLGDFRKNLSAFLGEQFTFVFKQFNKGNTLEGTFSEV